MQPDGAQLHVGREGGRPEQLGQRALGLAAAHVHLEQPVLGVHPPLEEEQVVAGPGPDVGDPVAVPVDPGRALQPGHVHRVGGGPPRQQADREQQSEREHDDDGAPHRGNLSWDGSHPEATAAPASSEPGEAYQSGASVQVQDEPCRPRGPGTLGGAMTRLRLPGGPWPVVPLVVVAVVVVALVAGGLFALVGGRRGGGGGLPGRGRRGGGGEETRKPAPVRVTVTPRDRATRVALDARARVVAESGRLRAVRVTGAGGRRLAGELEDGGRGWVSTGPLAPATRYRVVAVAVDDAGTPTRRASTFTTLRPRAELRAAIMPLDGETVGVGLPIGVWFSQPVADRAAVERRLQVTSSKPVTGAWHWFADNEVHYRPRSYWPSGSQGHPPGPPGRRPTPAAGSGAWPTAPSASASASAGSAWSTSGPTA